MTIYKWAISLRSFDPLKKQNSDLFCSSSLEVALIKYMLIGSSIHNRCLALLMLAFVPNDENSLTSVSESDNQLSLFFSKI